MATIKRFEEIEAWKVARELCLKIGSIIDEGSFNKSYRLIAQIEGSSGSIMDNIAEGLKEGREQNLFSF
jgi:four helix bundle protein